MSTVYPVALRLDAPIARVAGGKVGWGTAADGKMWPRCLMSNKCEQCPRKITNGMRCTVDSMTKGIYKICLEAWNREEQ